MSQNLARIDNILASLSLILTIWKAWAIPAANTPTPKKMRSAAPRLTVGMTPTLRVLPPCRYYIIISVVGYLEQIIITSVAAALDANTRSGHLSSGLLAPVM